MKFWPQMIVLKLVVGVGSSADPESVAGLLSVLPKESGIAVVIVQAAESGTRSLGVLRERSTVEIVEASANTVIEPNKAYLVGPDRLCTIKAGRLALEIIDGKPALPIDRLLRSLALDLGAAAAGI